MTLQLPARVGGSAPWPAVIDAITFSFVLAAGGTDTCTYLHAVEESYALDHCASGRVAGDLIEIASASLAISSTSSEAYASANLQEYGCVVNCLQADDFDPCTIDFCDPVTGAVTHSECIPNDPTVTTTIEDSLSALYSGPNAVQTGVAPATIDGLRAAAIVGYVTGPGGAPMRDATVTIVGHLEYGETRTDINGRFTMVVNGGGPLTASVAAAGFLTSQRTVDVPWQRYAHADAIELVPLDTIATEIDLQQLENETDVAVAVGSPSLDNSGSRQAVVMFSPGTTATLEGVPGVPGGVVDAPTLTMRLTEYTVGDTGPARMPANLPPTSAYTYAVEIGADEAIDAGATGIVLSEPVSLFVDNFIQFPVGAIVPVGVYDRERGVWVPKVNGSIIKIVPGGGGVAAIDLDDDGASESDETLEEYGLSVEERTALAERYAPGVELMHAELSHFTPVDLNLASRFPNSACVPLHCDPNDPEFAVRAEDENPCTRSGSIIECTTQVLGESAPIEGTEHTLHYQSNRTLGGSTRSVTVPISGPSLPVDLLEIHARLYVADQEIAAHFACPCETDAFATLTWDGNDTLGRPLTGRQPATVVLEYVYQISYSEPLGSGSGGGSVDFNESAFGLWSGPGQFSRVGRDRGRIRIATQTALGGWQNGSNALGRFSMDVVHSYDTLSNTLHRGDGTRRSANNKNLRVVREHSVFNATGATAIATLSDGRPVLSTVYGSRIVVQNANGTDTILAQHDGSSIYSGLPCPDGQPASSSCHVAGIAHIAVGRDDAIYTGGFGRVLRIKDGIVTLLAGGIYNAGASTGDGILARDARVNVSALAVAPDGSVYIGDSCAIRRINADAANPIINTVAGTLGQCGAGTNLVAASQTQFANILDLAFAPDGSLYVLQTGSPSYVLRRIRPDGVVEGIAGYGVGGPAEGADAAATSIGNADQVAVGPDGVVYIRQTFVGSSAIRSISPAGTMRTIAGLVGCIPATDECGLVSRTTAQRVGDAKNLHLTPSGNLRAYTANFVYDLEPDLPPHGKGGYLIADEDGRTVYRFDADGRHLDTTDAETKAVLYRMGYDPAGRLTSITDVDLLSTTVERSASGKATAIVGPYGHRTTLTIGANNVLTDIQDPNGAAWHATYEPNGLMKTWTNRNSHTTEFWWTPEGRLDQHKHPGNGVMTFDRTILKRGHEVLETTPLGRETTYRLEYLPSGDAVRTVINAAGQVTTSTHAKDRSVHLVSPDGTVVDQRTDSDQRWGMESLIPKRTVTTLPSGKKRTIDATRSFTGWFAANPFDFDTRTETVAINGRTWTTTLDRTGTDAIETTTSPLGRSAQTAFDETGRVIRVEQPGLYPVHYEYDADGRLWHTSQGDRHQYAGFGSDGLLQTTTDAIGRTTTLRRDLNGRVWSVERPDTLEAFLDYDGEGALTGVTPAGTPKHSFEFGLTEQLETYEPPAIGGWDPKTTYVYNTDKQLTTAKLPGTDIVVEYDLAGRPWRTTFNGGLIHAVYDPTTGQLTSLTGPMGVNLGFGYDGSIVTSTTFTGAVTGSVSWTLDGSATVPSNFSIVSETVSGANGSDTTSFQYDNDGLLTEATLGTTLTLKREATSGRVFEANSGKVSETFTYNGYGELESKSTSVNGAEVLRLTYLQRDDLGRIVEVEEIGGTSGIREYKYDSVGRLELVWVDGNKSETYGYDDNGNRRFASTGFGTVNCDFDDQDRAVSCDNGVVYGFTENGDLELVQDPAQPRDAEFAYDALGNLRTAWTSDGRRIDYLVDGRGRRVEKRVNGVVERRWLWRGQLQPVAELDGSNNVVARYVYAGGINAPELIVTSGATYRLIKDHLGSVRMVVDVDTGNVMQELQYDSYGRVLFDSTPGFQPFGFAGGIYDHHTGLVRFGARDYDAVSGRWTTKDLTRFAGGDNLYAYAGDDPVNLVDLTGAAPTREELTWLAGWFGVGNTAEMINERDLAIEAISHADVEKAACHAAAAMSASVAAVVEVGMLAASGGGGGSRGGGGGGGRGGNQFRGPDPEAIGPHTRFRTDAKGVTTYETYDFPSPGLGKRVDAVGPPHGGVPTPHTVETARHANPKNPTQFGYRESRPRPSFPEEIPTRRP
ncbi:MAG: hypothetical protein HOW73_27680 [Polyangiaceae bacterium]|nr:hypothetical protein [Polyangiaceae bacterium]